MLTPKILSGFMELLPEEQNIFDNMKAAIEKQFKLNGFLNIDTPILEYTNLLLAKAGGELDKEIYRFTKGDSDICMRYDLTVPLARFVSEHYNDLRFPFKRYQIGKAYRGERAQRGRYREFYQCDADIISKDELPFEADAEIVYLIFKVFAELEINDITINISNRKILAGLIEQFGYKEKSGEVMRILDKINKIGKEGAIAELEKIGVKDTDELFSVLENNGDIATKIEMLNRYDNPILMQGVKEFSIVINALKSLGVNEDNLNFDLSLVRGQDYYTGTIFETVVNGHPELGVVCGGGRYDNLTKYFSKENMAGVGMSVGLTRLYYILSTNNLLKKYPEPVTVSIIPFEGFNNQALALADKLRENEISCDVFYDNRSFKNKLKDAGRRGFPFVIFIGEDEVKNKVYTLKDMESGQQINVSFDQIIEKLRKRL